MLSENIRNYRKASNMSQDELAQKLGVSRQSVSLWENGQSQPTIDNIIALTKIFGVSSDELLDTSHNTKESVAPWENVSHDPRRRNRGPVIAMALFAVIVVGSLLYVFGAARSRNEVALSDTYAQSTVLSPEDDIPTEMPAEIPLEVELPADTADDTVEQSPAETPVPINENPDLFSYCKDFAIEIGELNGDHCMYQQPSTLYGGYVDEYFSISYWGDSDMVEFCLHCPLDDTLSINFYLRMRGGYDGEYEYLTSKYYRSDGTPIRTAGGYIDPAVFSEQYPLPCDYYDGSADGQNEFMEESRVGMCDLIKCLKEFVEVENMDCSFYDFDFVNF